jgi:hypothetical protein
MASMTTTSFRVKSRRTEVWRKGEKVVVFGSDRKMDGRWREGRKTPTGKSVDRLTGW